MRSMKSKRFTLMPLVALAALSLAVTLPALSATQVHAAKPVTYSTVTVHAGDNLWMLAERRTPGHGDVQDVVDQIIATNHLAGAAITPGQRLKVPN